ncbi:bifunctional DNA primase/polymerase [Streptomyces meridianus]|uniref:Bifunctional DNA primase/polymerase n=1 Tax=Streptomyces meridianus TaxID=2938945 RepID=A0ABT0X036_9ACTN|nr:bifunctional DNA primase/polymerase [Streptomyces meridianus]MCM2575888.1 bifunctional DNA primase/polymerase [Streptomyces meridianus]
MSDRQRNPGFLERHARFDRFDVLSVLDGGAGNTATLVTRAGAAWLASASSCPQSTAVLWSAHPGEPAVLPCGRVFDVVNVPAVFGRRMLDRLWAEGPGSGPVALHRGRMLLFAAPGTAQRLPSLLEWLGDPPTRPGAGRGPTGVPPVLCHGAGDAVTVPATRPSARDGASDRPMGPAPSPPGGRIHPEPAPASRWVVAPDTRHPWLPGADELLWACRRAARTSAATRAPGSRRARQPACG